MGVGGAVRVNEERSSGGWGSHQTAKQMNGLWADARKVLNCRAGLRKSW